MGDTLITVIAIFLAATLMFVFPLVSVSDRNDDIAQLTVQTETVEFVDNIRATGKLTQANYDAYVQKISATGNVYDIEMEIRHLDENPGKKSAQTASEKIGENVYYSEYASQINEKLNKNNGIIPLKSGDFVVVNAKNTNTTIAQSLKNFFYSISGNSTYQISASHSGVVMANGGK